MFFTSTLSSLLSGITSLELQNKVRKIPICLTLLYTTILVVLKLILNLIIYPTGSQKSSIIDLITPLGAPFSCDLLRWILDFHWNLSDICGFFLCIGIRLKFWLRLTSWFFLNFNIDINVHFVKINLHFFSHLPSFTCLCGQGRFNWKCHGHWLEVWHYQMWHQFSVMLFSKDIKFLILLATCESLFQDFCHLALEWLPKLCLVFATPTLVH